MAGEATAVAARPTPPTFKKSRRFICFPSVFADTRPGDNDLVSSSLVFRWSVLDCCFAMWALKPRLLVFRKRSISRIYGPGGRMTNWLTIIKGSAAATAVSKGCQDTAQPLG